MLDIADELTRWCARGRDFAAATVVAVSGSAPREVGAALAVDADGTAVWSVSGSGAVYELCQRALESGRGTLERFGYSDDDAFAVGLTCGGVIDVLVTPVRGGGLSDRVGDPGPGGGRAAGEASATLAAALDAAARGRAASLVRVVAGPAEPSGGALLVRPGGG